ncbi:Uncharacterized [Syntrophomonas zehnderi OL-4]|uniref:Uncharacterized n=1 Tax=Syntrophomonas zehnderi OL-4 TaxID=690567 RepID=A0A0E4C8F1_9FIRM|nr:hypothetical protein [Syntrophomonas zehnderi]CFX45903.1 Uncharacterized [Syntrophomonas zehnderi OL-4]
MESEELLISITSGLSKVGNQLRSLADICEYSGKRDSYIKFYHQLSEINAEILEDLGQVQDDESYTGILDRI